ncbi:MAG: metalloenzyme domain-containing protein [Chloroflexota bacterium]
MANLSKSKNLKLLFLFLDGVGLGVDDVANNPFAATTMPHLEALLGGRRMAGLAADEIIKTEAATLFSLDACLGIEGRPQSASGQATLLTGINIPKILGHHYGPKPNLEIREILQNGNLFKLLSEQGHQSALLNAFPSQYFDALDSRRRLPGAIAMAAREANIKLKTADDLMAGNAISADFTGQGWIEHLEYTETPILSLAESGERLAELAKGNVFSLFEFWISDLLGHRREHDEAAKWLKKFDQVLGALVSAWDHDRGLILITSDHGNLEDMSTRRHTRNPVPALLIGAPKLRVRFAKNLLDLSDITPAVLRFFD